MSCENGSCGTCHVGPEPGGTYSKVATAWCDTCKAKKAEVFQKPRTTEGMNLVAQCHGAEEHYTISNHHLAIGGEQAAGPLREWMLNLFKDPK